MSSLYHGLLVRINFATLTLPFFLDLGVSLLFLQPSLPLLSLLPAGVV